MGDIPGAREELDRLGRALRARMVELITDLTPGADLGLLFLDEPTVADWHEPLRHHYSALLRGERPASVGAADITSRAAALLDSAGWQVTTSQDGDGPRRWSVLTGRRGDSSIEIRVGHHMSAVMFSGQTPALALRAPEEFTWPEPRCTPETLTPGYLLCYECDGLGACPECGGRGWVPDQVHGRADCRACRRQRVCVICRGAGQLAASLLSPYQRGYYRRPG
ncbi:hypothetical protein [Streptomyces melanogenes]|uniref:hypothetical protein n=1 Tax=Streptomyces melanogenes TaxID=67326 RepID=UPI0037B45199